MSKEYKKVKLTDERHYFKPFAYPEFYEYWLAHEQMHWLFNEVPLLEDLKEWNNKLTDHEKRFLTQIFRFFTQSDIDVAGGYVKNFLPHFPQPEVRMMLCGFAAREALHIAAYSHLIESLGMPDTVYNDFFEYEAMREKHEYFESFHNLDKDKIAIQMAAFSAFTEGLQLFSSFIMLLNFPRNGKMKGMGQIITWSIVDESLHVEAMIKLFRTYIEENRHLWKDELKSQLYVIAAKMVELEDKFIDLAFSTGEMEDLTADDVKKYIRYIADRRLISMGLKGIFKIKKNPLPWVDEMINAPIHGNFFENRVTDYAKGAISGTWNDVWAQ
jgi:ribonucleoside-diphosphate reductase beta chain